MSEDETYGSVDDALKAIGEPVEERALVQYQEPGPQGLGRWGLLLRTTAALYVIYGEGQTIVRRLLNSSAPEQHRIRIPLDEVARVEVPGRGGWVDRLFSGPTRVATIHRRHEEPVRISVDRQGETLLRAISGTDAGEEE
ncbi:MAG: hypothetical protein ACOC1U_01245 [Spirochaetota bacterium]